jgi:UDP-2,3-diacylglucosamine pyrophosphatase LpxH
MQDSRKEVRVGLLTDIHYDGSALAMGRLFEAIATLNGDGVSTVIIMGDLINATGRAHAIQLLREISALCDSFEGEVCYMHGNHDLDHLSKSRFFKAIGREGQASCFQFEHGNHEFICLDGNFSPDGTVYKRGNFEWQKSYIPEEQLDWLRIRLDEAQHPVVVISHQRIDQPCIHAVTNEAAVREVLQESGKVKAVFQGHQHAEDLKKIDGIAYYTLSAHVDGAGPAVIRMSEGGIRLVRTFNSGEEC